MSATNEMRRVGDVVGWSLAMEGELFYVRDLVDREMVITGVAERSSDNGDYLAVSISLDGEKGFFFTSHQAIYQKLVACKDELPLRAVILCRQGRKSGRKYFDIE